MMEKFFKVMFIFFVCCAVKMHAEIQEIQKIEQILPAITEDTYVFFNVTEVLITSPVNLGSQAWRKYVKAKAPLWNNQTPFNVHDLLSLYVSKNIPQVCVETTTPEVIHQLQQQKIAVSGITGRGRNNWYSTFAEGIDELTNKQLTSVNIDFTLSKPSINPQFQNEGPFAYFYKGVFFKDQMKQAPFMTNVIQGLNSKPSCVVVIDDKEDCLEPIEAAMEKLGIRFVGFLYTPSTPKHRPFSPMVAHVQLESLYFSGQLLTDDEAEQIIKAKYNDVDPDQFFYSLLDRIFDSSQTQAMRAKGLEN